MQKIEKALSIVVREGVADNYVYPEPEMLNDDFDSGNTFKNPYFGDTPTPVKFMFGTQKELNIWLKETIDKYPVIWLVYRVKEKSTNDASDFYIYPGARLVFAINSDVSYLVNTRLQTTRFVLDQIVGKFRDLMRISKFKKFISIDKTASIIEEFWPNYSSTDKQETGGTIDVWDAITLDCDLLLNAKCITESIPKN